MSEQENRAAAQAQDAKAEKKAKAPAKKKDKKPNRVVRWFKDLKGELKKVTWPSAKATRKTHSPRQEAVEDGHGTVDRVTHPLPQPFAVLATQNPVGSAGTQDLPNSQLDRFLMKLSMGYPDLQSQIHILRDRSGEDPLTRVQAVADREALCEAIRRVRAIHIADPVYDYIARLTEATRSHPMVRLGISPRGALALCRCAKAAAFAAGRDFVLPEDAAELVPYVFGHRLMLSSRAKLNDYTPEAILAQVLEETPAPAMTERTL